MLWRIIINILQLNVENKTKEKLLIEKFQKVKDSTETVEKLQSEINLLIEKHNSKDAIYFQGEFKPTEQPIEGKNNCFSSQRNTLKQVNTYVLTN